LEEKFHKWQLESKDVLRLTKTLTKKGSLNCIHGDARNLEKLLGKIDAVVTSPPYSGSMTGSPSHPEKRAKRLIKAGHNPEEFLGGKARAAVIDWRYSKKENKNNIGNLEHGDIDVVITSPPYKTAMRGSGLNKNDKGLGLGCKWDGYSPNPENIDNLPYGKVDAVITSPPYENTTKDHGKSDRATKINIEKRNYGSWAYSSNPENIGNKAKETYLQAMLKVYQEMFKVLKPKGLAAVVVKPFIRNKTVVDLPYQTWQLLEKSGFQLKKLFKLRLDSQSFWRILYMKKYPDVPEIWHEYIIVCKKHSEVLSVQHK
jgi:DNA modification methylase